MTCTDGIRDRFRSELACRLPVHIERMGWDAERLIAWQQQALRHLLAHAIEHSPFHSRRLAGIDPERFDLSQLAELPTMTKAGMMGDFDEVVTDPRLKLADIEAHLYRTRRQPVLLAGDRFAVATGGSSGLKGVFIYDWDAMVNFGTRLLASGGPPGPGRRVIAAIGSPSAIHILRLGFALIDSGPLRIIDAPATLPIDEIVRRLNDAQPDVLFGYPAVLHRLAAEQDAGRLSVQPSRIRSTSATLSTEAEKRIASAFAVPILNTYGATEGLIGVRPPGQQAFAFASDLAIIELVDEQNRPVTPGAPSTKVLITNLFNFAQPLIRYEIEDCFVAETASAEHGHLVAAVQGRTTEYFEYGDAPFNPGALVTIMIGSPAVADYQIRQTAGGIEADILACAAIDTKPLAAEIEHALAGAGLANPQVSIRLVDALDTDPATGKHRRLLPLQSHERVAGSLRTGVY